MKKSPFAIIAFSILFLFLIQLAGTLVESIYILDLMNTSLDEKVLGLLFFFTPIILLPFRKRLPSWVGWGFFGILFLSRGLVPYLDTLGRMLASGIGLGAALCLLPILLTARLPGSASRLPASWIAAGFALSLALSVLLRTVNFGLDASLFIEGGWVSWLLGAGLGIALTQLDWKSRDRVQNRSRAAFVPTIGIFLVIGLAWFAFSAPGVIARWTGSSYPLIVSAVSLLALGWTALVVGKPGWIASISRGWLLAWNIAFSLALTLTILAHRVPFPLTPESPPVVVGSPGWLAGILLSLTLLLFPVIFLDLQVFARRIHLADPAPHDLIPGTLLGSLLLVLLVFIHIFTNVWGYVEPVSPWFRNKFWLPYLLLAGLTTLLAAWKGIQDKEVPADPQDDWTWGWAAGLIVLFLVTAGSALLTTRIGDFGPPSNSLVVMTYNIQGANDDFGERSYRQQLALIRQVDPDILALQESDTTRISLNNNDYVRYYAGKLGYYSYFGPTTVTGTYGTAILSKYPLENTRTVFSFSDQDEIGTAEAEIEIGGETFTIYDVHPDGSDTAMLVWAKSLLERSQGKSRVIALGDYNLRDYEEAYQLIDEVYTNAWTSVYPTEISPDGTDMSGENRIDHIFLSPDLEARDPIYLLPPQSATDHPVHWSVISWKE